MPRSERGRRLALESRPVVLDRLVPEPETAILVTDVSKPGGVRSLERDAVGVLLQAVVQGCQSFVPGLPGVAEFSGGGEEIAGGGLAFRQVGEKLFARWRLRNQPLADGQRLSKRRACVVQAADVQECLGQVLSAPEPGCGGRAGRPARGAPRASSTARHSWRAINFSSGGD